jgi:adenylate kinase
MNMILHGPPGAGKGTLAKLLIDRLHIAHISTGDILRDEMKAGSELGVEVKGYIESGALVPDEVVIKIIDHRFKTDETLARGYMLDGFPRTGTQAESLDKILKASGKDVDFALYMEASIPVIIKRITGRRLCRQCGAVYHITNRPPEVPGVCDKCGSTDLYQRSDDTEETVLKRMAVYFQSTEPVLDFYRKQNKLWTVNGDEESEVLLEELIQKIDEDKTQHQNQNA